MLRMLSDNCLIALEPPPNETASGIAIVQRSLPLYVIDVMRYFTSPSFSSVPK